MKKFTNGQLFNVYDGCVIPQSDDSVEIYFENFDTELLQLSPLHTYDIGGIHPHTLNDIEQLLINIKKINLHETVNAALCITDGYLYDSEDEDYTRFSELEESFQEEILEAGTYSSDTQTFISIGDISGEWIKYLTVVIAHLEPLVEEELEDTN